MSGGRSESADSPSATPGRGRTFADAGPCLTAMLGDTLRETLAHGRNCRVAVEGGSMYPFIRAGDLVEIAPPGAGPVSAGDVVAFAVPSASGFRLHRVLAVAGGTLAVKGDNGGAADEPVPLDRLLGRVVRIERGGRRVWLGLGPERRLLARLSRRGPVLAWPRRIRAWFRRFAGRG